MASMSYCRWENTLSGIGDCHDALENMEYRSGVWYTQHEDSADGDIRLEELNQYEQRALRSFLTDIEALADTLRRRMS